MAGSERLREPRGEGGRRRRSGRRLRASRGTMEAPALGAALRGRRGRGRRRRRPAVFLAPPAVWRAWRGAPMRRVRAAARWRTTTTLWGPSRRGTAVTGRPRAGSGEDAGSCFTAPSVVAEVGVDAGGGGARAPPGTQGMVAAGAAAQGPTLLAAATAGNAAAWPPVRRRGEAAEQRQEGEALLRRARGQPPTRPLWGRPSPETQPPPGRPGRSYGGHRSATGPWLGEGARGETRPDTGGGPGPAGLQP